MPCIIWCSALCHCSFLIQTPTNAEEGHSEEENEFILSGSTASQLKKLNILSNAHSSSLLLYVEGPHRIWINKIAMPYFSLRLSSNDSRQFNDDSEEGK